MIAFLMPFLPYILGFAAIVGVIGVHDYRVRAKEADKWKPKLTQCEANVSTATDANKTLKADYDGFITKHNQMLKALADQQRAALARKDAAIAALGLREQAGQHLIEELRVKANAAPLATKEASCEQATATLRGLAADLVRDDAANK